jgi:putative ABC transport system permease protein
MRYFALLWANLKRRKVRTLLTLGSFAVALFLFGVLAAIQAAFNQGVEVAGVDRLVVRNRTSLIQPLPIAYRQRILQTPGVRQATFATWFGGVYQEERNFFPQFAIDSPTWHEMYPEFVIPPEQWEAFVKDREGCIVGEGTAKKYGFKVGDRIPLKGTIWAGLWEFNVRGIYTGSRNEDDTSQFWFHYAYLDERRPFWKGLVGWYVVKVENPDQAVLVARSIDERFANSPYETAAETEKAFATGFVKQVGDIQALILSIGAVVFVTLLLVTGNTMAMSVKERTGEIAVLKSIGFSDVSVMGLILAEGLLMAAIGGGLGVAGAKAFTLRGDPTGGMLALFYFPPMDMVKGMLLALGIGTASALWPALYALRLRVVDALRRA